MHGVIAIKNRNGRKRKSGRRTSSGALARRAPMDYRAMAAQQPHRIGLPEALRGSEKAVSVIGCLNLLGRISDHQYEAGRRYSVIVGAYYVASGITSALAGNGRSSGCNPEQCLSDSDHPCQCREATNRFMRAYEAIPCREWNLAVNRIAIHDELCPVDLLPALRGGLQALVHHFGLTNHRKRADT